MNFIPMMILAIVDDNDRAFITELYLSYRNLMYSIAIDIVNDHQDAEDMVALAITEMIENIEVLRKINHLRLRSYIASIVRNDSIDFIRKRKRYTLLSTDEKGLDDAPDDSDVDDTILQRAEIRDLENGIAKLTRKEQTLLLMKYVDEQTDKQIAQILHIGQDSVRVYLSRAKRRLLTIMKEAENDG